MQYEYIHHDDDPLIDPNENETVLAVDGCHVEFSHHDDDVDENDDDHHHDLHVNHDYVYDYDDQEYLLFLQKLVQHRLRRYISKDSDKNQIECHGYIIS